MSSAALGHQEAGWRPSRRLSLRATGIVWLVCLLVISGAAVLQHLSSLQVDGVSALRVSAAAGFLWLVTAWLWPDRSRRTAVLAVTASLIVVVHAVLEMVAGTDPLVAWRVGGTALVQVAVTFACYRWRMGDDNLAPHRPSDVVALLVSSLVGAVVVLPLGPAPGLWPTGPPFDLVWWVTLSAGYVFVGGACILLLVARGPRSEAIRTRVVDVSVQLLVTAACLGLVFTFDDYPLTWLVLLPAIWAGMTIGPWASAAYGLTVAVAVVTAQCLPAVISATGSVTTSGDRASLVLLDSLVTAFVFVVLLLSLVRDQRAFLAGEVVSRRQEAMDQAGLLSTVFESISDALVLMDREGNVRLHNAAAVGILGHDRVEVEPTRWLRRMSEGPSFSYSFNRDGSADGVRVLAVQLAEVQYAGAGGVVAVARDVTTEQRRIEELTGFAAVAAHDLKSPLAAVQGWIEVAQDSVHNDVVTAGQALERGRNATDRMAREIDDWLTYNVAREGAVAPETVALQPTIDSIVATYPEGDFLVETPDSVRADPTLLRHLLVNLVGNAVKYTRPGEKPVVTIRSFLTKDQHWVRIYVVDAGIGIPEGQEQTIFEPFRRASEVEALYDGSGLGLALAKRIVRRHGGLISAERNEGPGSTFMVTLPRA